MLCLVAKMKKGINQALKRKIGRSIANQRVIMKMMTMKIIIRKIVDLKTLKKIEAVKF